MYIFLLNSQSHKIVGNPDNYKLLCHLISSSLLLPLNSIRFGARRITFLVTELVTLKSYNSTMSVSYQSTELWMTCGQYCKWFSQEKHLCTGRESTRPGGKKCVAGPFPLTSRNKPRVFYPGERESILHSGSADGSATLPLRLSLCGLMVLVSSVV